MAIIVISLRRSLKSATLDYGFKEVCPVTYPPE
jgi:hypothetical protein